MRILNLTKEQWNRKKNPQEILIIPSKSDFWSPIAKDA